MIDSEVRNMNALLGKSISRNEMVNLLLKTHRNDKGNLKLNIVLQK